MRASPPIEVESSRDGPWRGFVLAVVLASGGVVAAWIVLGDGTIAPVASVVAVAAALAAAALALSVARPRPARLRWDGLTWRLSDAAAAGREPAEGHVAVAIDLGSWMLLRFTADPARGGRVTWLPLQRRGLPTRWHALRCALYSPPPVPDTP